MVSHGCTVLMVGTRGALPLDTNDEEVGRKPGATHMILTICLFSFASLVSPYPSSEDCYKATEQDLRVVSAKCALANKDPLSTCEIQRVGATKWYVRLRTISGGTDEGPVAVKKEEV